MQRDTSTADANRLHEQRYLGRSLHGDGSMTISIELPRESGELVMKTLELAVKEMDLGADAFESEEDIAETKDSHLARQADALVQMAKGYFAGGNDKKSSTADHYQVMVHVDEDVLRQAPTDKSKSDLPCETIRWLCCDSGVVFVTQDDKGNPLNVSRKHRVVQPPLKRALLARDKCCRFPGCTHEKWLDAQSLPRFMGTTWSIGQMGAKPACRIHYCYVQNTTGYCMREDFESKKVMKGSGSSKMPVKSKR